MQTHDVVLEKCDGATSANEHHVFVHAAKSKPKRVVVTPTDKLIEVLARAGIVVSENDHIFMGDWKMVIDEQIDVDDGEDVHVSLHRHETIEVLGIGHGCHVHCHHCRRISVTVHYQNHRRHHRFSPAQTVETVTKWARKKFQLSDIDAEKLKLMICDSTTMPRPSETLGELVHAPACEICFNLVPDPKVNG